MKEENSNSINNSDLLPYLHKHFMIIKSFSEVSYDGAKENGNNRLKDVYPVINGIVSKYSLDNFCNDAYIIAKILIEQIITFLYLQHCEGEEYNNYIAHSKQKVYRKLDQNIQVKRQNIYY